MSKYNTLAREVQAHFGFTFPSAAIRTFTEAYGAEGKEAYGFLNLEIERKEGKEFNIYVANGYKVEGSKIKFICPKADVCVLTLNILMIVDNDVHYTKHPINKDRQICIRLGTAA